MAAKTVVFLLHGIGIHPENWASGDKQGPVAKFKEAVGHYPGFGSGNAFDDAIEIVELRYDDIFDQILSRWSGLISDLRGSMEQFSQAGIDKVHVFIDTGRDEKLQAIQSELGNQDNWFVRSALDVPLYTEFAAVRKLVQLRVVAEITGTIAKKRREDGNLDRRFVLIAHSLGTTVAHDAVALMARTPWLNQTKRVAEAIKNLGYDQDGEHTAAINKAVERFRPNPFAPGIFSFNAIFMVSNTSALLHQTKPGPTGSVVRPKLSGGDSMCDRFFNVDHILDPIGNVKGFRSEKAWPRAARFSTTRDLFDIDHVYDINVHGLGHYFINPVLHREILRQTVSEERFSRADYDAALARLQIGGGFSRWGPAFQNEDQREALLSALEKLNLTPNARQSEFADMLIAMAKVFNEVKAHV